MIVIHSLQQRSLEILFDRPTPIRRRGSGRVPNFKSNWAGDPHPKPLFVQCTAWFQSGPQTGPKTGYAACHIDLAGQSPIKLAVFSQPAGAVTKDRDGFGGVAFQRRGQVPPSPNHATAHPSLRHGRARGGLESKNAGTGHMLCPIIQSHLSLQAVRIYERLVLRHS